MFEDEGFLEVLILVFCTFVEHSWVKDDILLSIGLSQGFVFTFLEIEELILHIDSFLVLDDYDLVVRVVAFILEPAQFLHVDFLLPILIMGLHTMQPQLLGILEGDELLSKAVLVVTDVMRYLVVRFKFIVVFVVAVSFLLAANVTEHVLQIDVNSKLVLVEEVTGAEFAVWMHEGHIAELIDISFLEVAAESLVGV